ncbi:hypothetical protein SERLADRAFT_446259 [Serpula lacrymans var. lacrymans S7.9]|uniref:Uncharacterized protein n=1 Tax=Serpula lacrymans var. lacrymans (strain S7.9) TaxID=578457 RepID=F8NL74_SERL9|nr:uncharacterized protein SERLADRAFT_446259 [Serpula lacrymans var. lacrymans S7.9]EGO28890.1 hypothetical protein SERLADRAFT_446259 [Serpula lacrymans var. lacrymans S7.9]
MFFSLTSPLIKVFHEFPFSANFHRRIRRITLIFVLVLEEVVDKLARLLASSTLLGLFT